MTLDTDDASIEISIDESLKIYSSLLQLLQILRDIAKMFVRLGR